MSGYDSDDLTTEELALELGYRDFDWDQLDDAEVERHDEIIEMSPDELAKLDVAHLTDLQKWAAAQAWAEHEELEQFSVLSTALINGDHKHPALDYGEIGLELVSDLMLEEQFSEARALLARVAPLVDDEAHLVHRYEASLDILEGDRDTGLEKIQSIIDQNETDPVVLLALAEDLLSVGEFEQCGQLLDQAEDLARMDNDRSLLEDIAEARSFLEEYSEE